MSRSWRAGALAAALALSGVSGEGSARRVLSTNLCTDELLVQLARPQEIAGLSFFSADPLESPYWKMASHYPLNDGTIEKVLPLHAGIVLTMGGSGKVHSLLARQLGIHVLDLPIPASIDDVIASMRAVAIALGDSHRADRWIARIEELRTTAPEKTRDAIFIGERGESFAPHSLGAQWLRLAGLRQRPLLGGRATLETLLVDPPQVLVVSNYRAGQTSLGSAWLANPIVRNAPAQRLITDGRRWTCMGPLMAAEIERLRRAAR